MSALYLAVTYLKDSDNFWFAYCSIKLADLAWPTKKTQIRDKKFDIASVDKNILVVDNIKSGFFKLMLLTQCSEEGIQYSPRTNYCLATKEKMTVKNILQNSMLEYAMSSGNTDEFSSTKIALTFYQIDQTETDIEPPTLTSISKETVNQDNKPMKALKSSLNRLYANT
jgi:hypothetical protein